MRFSSRTWSWISLTLLVAAAVFLWLDRQAARNRGAASEEDRTTVPAVSRMPLQRQSPFPLLSGMAAPGGAGPGLAGAPAGGIASPAEDTLESEDRGRYFLANTSGSVEDLVRVDTVLLLENAFIDTARGALDGIPEHLRAAGEPGGYLVQFHRPLDREFYQALERAGAQFVAYVPNHAALVRADSRTAADLERMAGIQAVLPFEPYFKLAEPLLPMAVDGVVLDPGQGLQVLVYPDADEQARLELESLGVEVLGTTRSPFGTVFQVQAPMGGLVPLVQLAEVQRVELWRPRVLMNDLARLRVRVATNQFTNTTYLGLTGKGVLVNINDTGVDVEHPGLRGRVVTTDPAPWVLVDPDGHGTHVAGTLAGDGAASEGVTNILGSWAEAVYSGMATQAEVHVLPIDLAAGPLVSDSYLQEAAAREYYLERGGTNLLVSNNSWNYAGSSTYDLAAASYDAAVRDALPDLPGSQPLLFVFAAGNAGGGTSEGQAGRAGSIASPATAKNVITVGTIEQPRFLTNTYYTLFMTDGSTTNVFELPESTNDVSLITTNLPFMPESDSDNQVASFSSRGNVGIGREGTWGRFKPDVVAPGTYVLSARSAAWRLETQLTNTPLFGLLPLYEELNEGAEPHYRFETGTSMSAPVVSGLLVLMQEFLEQTLGRNYNPALLKALLLHGTRPVNPLYDLESNKRLNLQGWGLPNLTNSLPADLEEVAEAQWPLRMYADTGTNVLATGQAHTWTVEVSSNAVFVPFRATLVWTDPPGNPGAALKLVNDLDLVLTNLTTGQVFYGNNIDGDFSSPRGIESPPEPDFVNNVENLILPSLQTSGESNVLLSVTVAARRVNVNAVTANTTDVVQDYALIFSAGEGLVTNPIVSVTWEPPAFELLSPRVLTNGVAELRQRAGANFQLAPGTNGVRAQWAFYVFTNTFFEDQNVSGLTNGSNVAFITFLPPNLSRPRNFQSDIDLYVTKDPRLLELNPDAIAASFKSLKRGGTELVAFTNALTNDVFFVGVKAEDQQAAEFGLVVQSSDLPFVEEDEFGNKVASARNTPVLIPDGSPEDPGGVILFVPYVGEPVDITRVMVELDLRHESVGDLVGVLGHVDDSVAVHNRNLFDGSTNNFWSLIYEDNPSGNFPGSRYSDGPGSLNSFIGHSSEDVWLFTITDDVAGRGGAVDRLTLRFTPNQLGPDGVVATVPPNEWLFFFVDVPLDAVRLTVFVEPLPPNELALDLYLRRDEVPTFDAYDKYARIPALGGALALSRFDAPPLNPGRYFIGVYNPNPVAVTFRLSYLIETDLNAVNRGGSASTDTPLGLWDDAITRSTIFIAETRPVLDIQVGVRVDHPRASDLVFHLISPQGTRVLLAENRGGTSVEGYGSTLMRTNVASRSSSGGPEEDRQIVGTGVRQGVVEVEYEFFTVPDTLRVYYDSALIYDTGLISGPGSFSVGFGPGSSTNVVVVVNEGGSSEPTTLWNYTLRVVTQREAYTVFTEQTNLTTLPIKFASPPFTNSPGAAFNTNRVIFADGFEQDPTGTNIAPALLRFWEVLSGAVVVHGAGNPLAVTAAEGSQFLEMRPGSQPAAIGVRLGTTRGARYQASVAVRRNPTGPVGGSQAIGLFVDGLLLRWVPVEGDEWRTVSTVWEASAETAGFEVRTTTAQGALVDAVVCVEQLDGGEAYFLPEEDLMRPLKGEPPYGDWTLEIRDDRVGAGLAAPSPLLLSWTLNFIFANTNPPVTELRPCTPGDTLYGVWNADCESVPQLVEGDEIVYFAVQAPLVASTVTNLVLSVAWAGGAEGDLVLLHNNDGLPNGLLPGDVVVDARNVVGEALVLVTNTVPSLVPGQRYYLGVANAFPDQTNAFHITAQFDRVDDSLLSLPVLSGPVTNTVAGTNTLAFYQYAVSTNTVTHVTFELEPQDGDVDLYVRKAQPVPDPLPRPNPAEHDYASTNSGITPELVVLTRASDPVPLDDGLWYVGVFNGQAVPVTYRLEAREWFDLVTLTNNLAFGTTIPATNGLRYYQFDVSPFATNLQFHLTPANGDVNLYVGRVLPGPLPFPGPARFDYASAVPGLGPELVEIDWFSPVPLSGTWFLAVENAGVTAVDYTIRAVEISGASNVIPLTDGVPLTWTILAGQPVSTYFVFRVDQASPSALFEVYDLDQPVDMWLEYEQPPLVGSAYRHAQGTPDLPPQIVLRTATGDPGSLLGDWYLEIVGDPTQDLTFTIRAATASNGLLTSGRPLGLSIRAAIPPATGWQFNWNSVDGERYVIESSSDLSTWNLVTTITASGSVSSFTDPSPVVQPALFYRVRQIP
jgi:subtilisin-like proprotein convertase family protein